MDGSFNADAYWRSRHQNTGGEGELSSVGLRSYSNNANYFSYKLVIEQYGKILSRLNLPKNTTFLDAGAGIGIFAQFLSDNDFQVTALDVSEAALDQISNRKIKKVVGSLPQIEFAPGAFDVVHCFDVLYHIVDDEAWEGAVRRLCGCSRNYLILHERFMRFGQFMSSRHVKMRPYRKTREILEAHDFYEVMSIPTHLIAMRLLTYRLIHFAPEFFYRLDRFFLPMFESSSLRSLGSHHIKVFEKKAPQGF